MNRKASDIQIIAVTKTFPFDAIESAYNHNILIIGESRVQETIAKIINRTTPKEIEMHLIGHLQSNKINKAISIFDVIETIDSIQLAKKINTACQTINKTQRIYIQVNPGNDSSKYGFLPDDTIHAATIINELSHITIEGIMMIPPFIEMNDVYRNIFKKTKQLQLDIYNSGIKTCHNISMGMSRDYELAVEEGATHIRLGTALFSNRK